MRFGAGSIEQLSGVAEELGLARLLLVTSRRGASLAPRLPVAAVYDGVRSHVPVETVREAANRAESADADGLVGLGGGSAIDCCKAVTLSLLERREVRTIAVPTTYAGAEWTPYFGMRDEASGTKSGGSHERARPVAAIYDPELTLGLPRAESAGTAMNALAHCAEAFYVQGRSERGDRHAHCGARTIAYALPLVLADGGSLYARTRLLEGAMRSAWALAEAGLALGHAMAQALGGRYGLPHGALNAVCLPAALRFNEPAAPEAIAKLGEAMGTDDPIAKVEELARLGGFERLRDLGVPEAELGEVAELTAVRPGARANPRPASAAEIEELLRGVW
ncbi:MAG: iron-containing alcohol dehydrogenase family protein [Gaiellaceae bacterium]